MYQKFAIMAYMRIAIRYLPCRCRSGARSRSPCRSKKSMTLQPWPRWRGPLIDSPSNRAGVLRHYVSVAAASILDFYFFYVQVLFVNTELHLGAQRLTQQCGDKENLIVRMNFNEVGFAKPVQEPVLFNKKR